MIYPKEKDNVLSEVVARKGSEKKHSWKVSQIPQEYICARPSS